MISKVKSEQESKQSKYSLERNISQTTGSVQIDDPASNKLPVLMSPRGAGHLDN